MTIYSGNNNLVFGVNQIVRYGVRRKEYSGAGEIPLSKRVNSIRWLRFLC